MKAQHMHWSRRDFLKAWALGVMTWSALPAWAVSGKSDQVNDGPDVWVINGQNPERLMRRCLDVIQQQGGFGCDFV